MPTQPSRDTIINTYRDRIRSKERFRLTKDDLGCLVEGFVDLLQGANTEKKIKMLCEAEIKLLEEGYPQASVAKYMTRYRKAIAVAIEDGLLKLTKANSHRYIHQQRVTGVQEERLEHWALTYLKYSPEVYESIDKRSQLVNRDKQLNLRLVPVEQYLEMLREFLAKKGRFEARWLATAIAGLTGRRFAEVVAKGTFFLTEHPYLLRFEGQIKSRAGHGEGFDIVTLFLASEVLEAIQRLRRLPEVKEIAKLKGASLSAALNVFNQKLNSMCGRALMQVVPPMEGKKTISVHNLRSLYGAIAVYLFCPENQHEYAFVQHFLGHVMDSPATGHYFRFSLGDETGKLIREKGVLLTQVAQLPLGGKTSEDEAIAEIQDVVVQETAAIPNDFQALLDRQLEAIRSEFEARIQEIRQESDAGWFVRRVEGLERENLALRLERDRAINSAGNNPSYAEELAQLQAENDELSQKLKLAQDKLDGFKRLLSGDEFVHKTGNEKTQVTTAVNEPKTIRLSNGEVALLIELPKTKAIHDGNCEEGAIAQQTAGKPRGPKAGKAFRRAEAIVLGIKDWNRLNPAESFAINAGILETVFRIHRQAVKEFFDAYQNELWDYHQELGVESPRWHNRGKDTEKLKDFVEKRL